MIHIITINKNNLKGLKETADSIISQSFQEFKWLIIDGNSTDGSIDFIRNLDFKGLSTIIEDDNGIYDAMNKGIDYVDELEMILFLNSGDKLFNINVLSNINKSLFDNDIIYGDLVVKEEINSNVFHNKINQPSELNILWYFYKTLNHQSYLLRAKYLKKYRFDLNFKIVADWVQFMRILESENNLKISKIPYVISIYDGNGFSKYSNYKLEREIYLKSKYSQFFIHSANKFSSLVTYEYIDDLNAIVKSKYRKIALSVLIKILNFKLIST